MRAPGGSAAMPGSDTALTVDRTYSDPGRHQRCKSRVSGARSVAPGARGGGARPGGLRLPRALTRRPRFAAAALPPLLPRVRASPRLSSLKGLGRRASGPGSRLRDPTSTAGVGRRAKPGPRRPAPAGLGPASAAGTPSLPDGRAPPPSPPGSARRAVPGREGIPPPAAPRPQGDSRPPLPTPSRRRRRLSQPPEFRARGRAAGLPGPPRGGSWLCPGEKSVLAPLSGVSSRAEQAPSPLFAV